MIDVKARKGCPDWSVAVAHLCAVEPRFVPLVARSGPCTLAPRPDCFAALCQSILSQQISTKAARTVWLRFAALFPRRKVVPEALLSLSDADFKAAGIGPQRQSYLRALAAAQLDGTLPPPARKSWHTLTDDEVIRRLTEVRGIGRWTAEMFLMFVLCRPDVLPVHDLGLQMGAAKLIGHREKRLEPADVLRLAEKWSPYRTVATWYIWRGFSSDDFGAKSNS